MWISTWMTFEGSLSMSLYVSRSLAFEPRSSATRPGITPAEAGRLVLAALGEYTHKLTAT